MAEHWTQIPLLKYFPGRVLYYKKTLLKSVIHNSRTPLVSYAVRTGLLRVWREGNGIGVHTESLKILVTSFIVAIPVQ